MPVNYGVKPVTFIEGVIENGNAEILQLVTEGCVKQPGKKKFGYNLWRSGLNVDIHQTWILECSST